MSNTSFYAYLLSHLPDCPLLEISDLFPRDQINELFYREIDRLLREVGDHQSREELLAFRRMDPVSYMDGALRRSGFQDHDLDSLVHDLVVKLIVRGNLFSGWVWGQSLIGRFKISVGNYIKTLATKRSKARRRTSELRHDHPVRQTPHEDLIREFRAWLSARYGELAARVLDHRLEGGSTGDLLGAPGIETSYKLKQLVQRIKEGAREYFQRDPEFFQQIQRAFETEQQTMMKRFPARV
jgi:hypothetical protein